MAHRCVDLWHNLARKVDLGCTEAEEDPKLSASSIARRRTELCEQALTQLANFRPLEIAEKAFGENIDLHFARSSIAPTARPSALP
jgi:hypothetical protein